MTDTYERPTFTYEGPSGLKLTITVHAANIELPRYGRGEVEISPMVHIESTEPVKMFGKLYDINVYAKVHKHDGRWYIDHSYGYGYIKTGEDRWSDANRLGWQTKSRERMDLLMHEALAWLDDNHIAWRRTSHDLGWSSLIRGQQYEISKANKAIAEAQAEIVKLRANLSTSATPEMHEGI